MEFLVDCSYCRTPLSLPLGAYSVRCILCHAITHIVGHPPVPPPYTAPHQLHIPHTSVWPFPSPSPHSRSLSQVTHPAGSRRALLCGITYKDTDSELPGCLNDAKFMKHLLVSRFHFPESSILMLTEEETDPYRKPTKANIRMAMNWLVQGCQPGDSLVFQFSGHGCQESDLNGDEIDGFDEAICPLDYDDEGSILDDEINSTLVRPLPRGAKLHAIMDACHSGTVLDLPYVCKMDRDGRYTWDNQAPKSGMWKGTNGGEAISFSGCDDHQQSLDTQAFAKVTSTGAMTFAFIEAIERGKGRTYGDLLAAMRSAMRHETPRVEGKMTALLMMLLAAATKLDGIAKEEQEPQLSSNEPFEVYSKPFML